MKPLAMSQRVFTWLSIYPGRENDKTVMNRISYYIFTCIVCLSVLCGLIASIAFIVKSIDLKSALYALFQVTMFLEIGYSISVALLLRRKITAIFDGLTKICDEHTESFFEGSSQIFIEVSDKSERMWIFLLKYMSVSSISSVIVATVSVSISCARNKHFNAKDLFHPIMVILPWNRETLIGYFGEIFFTVITGEAAVLTFTSILILFISICFHYEAFYKVFGQTLIKLEESNNRERNKRLLHDIIRFHALAKDLFLLSTEVFNHCIEILLFCNMIAMACCMFQLDLIGILVVSSMLAFSTLFLYCYFGKVATESFENMADCVFESNWQMLPIELQKYVILMIANAQRPIYYRGFGIAVLKLETFCKVIKMVFTYFMMFKAITK